MVQSVSGSASIQQLISILDKGQKNDKSQATEASNSALQNFMDTLQNAGSTDESGGAQAIDALAGSATTALGDDDDATQAQPLQTAYLAGGAGALSPDTFMAAMEGGSGSNAGMFNALSKLLSQQQNPSALAQSLRMESSGYAQTILD